MHVTADFAAAVGNTPLIRMNRLSEETGCEILCRAELMSPCGPIPQVFCSGGAVAGPRHGVGLPQVPRDKLLK